MSGESEWIWRLSWPLLIIGLMITNQFLARQRLKRQFKHEAQRLRAALAAELRILQELYQANIDLLARDANYVLSTRAPLLVCRSSLPRLTSLFDAAIIEQLVEIYAGNEMLEAHVAAHAQPRAGLSYRLLPVSRRANLPERYAAAARELAQARVSLDLIEVEATPSTSPMQWIYRVWRPAPEPRARESRLAVEAD
jgi:hypothetical protein